MPNIGDLPHARMELLSLPRDRHAIFVYNGLSNGKEVLQTATGYSRFREKDVGLRLVEGKLFKNIS